MPITHLPTVQSFLDYLTFQKRYSHHTIISYENDLRSFFQFVGDEYNAMPLADITPAIVRTWLASLKVKKMEAKSINRKISALKSFFKFQLREGEIKVSPMATIISPKNKKRLPQYLDERGTQVLFNDIEFADDWEGKTHRMILTLLYGTGMRRAELIGLKESHIDPGNCQVKVLGKGNKERVIPVSRELINSVTEYMRSKRVQFEIFSKEQVLVNKKGKPLDPKYVYNVVKHYLSLGEVTTIEKRSPHALRHTFATHLMNNGADINAVKELLGHSSLAATQIYTHNTIEKLKDIHKQAHPKA